MTVTVAVGTPGEDDPATISVSVTYSSHTEDGKAALFNNVYEAAPATASPTVAKTVKTLDGCDYHVTDGQFSFTLSAVSAPDGVELAADQVASCADGGTASFGELTFSSAGTYVFQVSENEVDPALALNVSHDDTTYTLTYVVEEGADRNLHVTSTAVVPSALDDEHAAGESDEGIAFVNHETPTTPDTPATPSTPTTPDAPTTPSTPDAPDTPSAVTPTAPHDKHHMPQTGDTLGGVRLAVVLVTAAGVAFVALGLAGARRRMRR